MLIVQYDNRRLWYILIAESLIIAYQFFNPGKVAGISILMHSVMLLFFYELYRYNYLSINKEFKLPKLWIYLLIINAIRLILFGDGTDETNRDAIIALTNIAVPLVMFLPVSKNLMTLFKIRTFTAVTLAVMSSIYWKGYYGFIDVPHLLMPFTLFIIIVPFVKYKWKIYIILMSIISLFSDISVRTNLLLIGYCMMLLVTFLFFNKIFNYLSKIIRISCFILPFILLPLSTLGVFNVFEEISKQDVSISGGTKDRDFSVDSRTIIYKEFADAIYSSKTLIIGDGPFSYYEDEYHNSTGPFITPIKEVEPGILNIFKYYGIVGSIVFFMLFWNSSKFAIEKSNNDMVRLAGLYVAFKFLLLFVEESSVSIDTYLAIGICFNQEIRRLTNYDVRYILSNSN